MQMVSKINFLAVLKCFHAFFEFILVVLWKYLLMTLIWPNLGVDGGVGDGGVG